MHNTSTVFVTTYSTFEVAIPPQRTKRKQLGRYTTTVAQLSTDTSNKSLFVALCGQVNLALVLDGSDSIEPSDYELEQQFAVDTVAAFAAPNLFNNGGMASYVQHSTTLVSSGTFDSAQDLKDFLDADVHAHGYTYTNLGIDEGAALLTALDATASCMIVIFGGKSTIASDTVTAAGNARAAGITLFALGVGEFAASNDFHRRLDIRVCVSNNTIGWVENTFFSCGWLFQIRSFLNL